MTVHISKSLGRYNWAGIEKSWCVVLLVKIGDGEVLRIDETWEEDDEPLIDDQLPSEVLDQISKRLESYWINTAREAKRIVIGKMREVIKQADIEFVKDKLASLDKEIASWNSVLEDLENQ